MRRIIAQWTYGNCGGTNLLSVDDEKQTFVILSGPTPWGTGLWGRFPMSAIIAGTERDPLPTDSFPVNGCPSESWTVADLDRAIANAKTRWGWE